jgi:predicted transcriptional regulator of viral defense system
MTKILDLYKRLPDVFSVKAVARELGTVSVRTIDRHISGYVKEGKVLKMKNGLYAKTSADQFDMALQLYKGYIGFSSALYLHRLKNEVEDYVYVCTEVAGTPTQFGGSIVVPVYLGRMCFGTTLINGVLVSTYPKTIFDMLYRPRYASFFDLYRAIRQRELSTRELDELIYYIERSNLSTIRRAGYALEGVVPEKFIGRLRRLNSSKGKSFFLNKRAANFNKEWSIYDDVGVRRWINAAV